MIEKWRRPDEKYIAVCPLCGEEFLKKHMEVLYIKHGAYDNPRVLCHICQDCLPKVLEELGVSER